MGETEDEFARAEALLAELEGRSGVSQPQPVPAQPPHTQQAEAQDFDFEEIIDVEAVPEAVEAVPNTQATIASNFRLGAHYKISLEHFSRLCEGHLLGPDRGKLTDGVNIYPRAIYSNDSTRRLVDIPYEALIYQEYVFLYVLEKTDVAMKVSIGLRTRHSLVRAPFLSQVPGSNGYLVYHLWIKFADLEAHGILDGHGTSGSERDRFVFVRENVDIDLLQNAYNEEIARLLKVALKEKQRKKKVEEEYENNLQTIAALAEEIYPGNTQLYTAAEPFIYGNTRDFFRNANIRNHAALLIRFPEIVITNRDKRNHNIKDLFVWLSFGIDSGHNFFMSSNLYGARATVNSAEYHSRYRHSHLQTGNEPNFVNFCQGGGTPTSIATAELRSNFTMEKFELFLYQLSTYVRYESLEGGPYIRMENIRGRSRSTRSVEPERDLDHYIEIVKMKNLQLPVKTAVVNGNEQFVFNDKDPVFLKELGEVTRTPYVKTANGSFEPLGSTDQTLSDSDKRSLTRDLFEFRGERIQFKVVDPTDNVGQDAQKYPSPMSVAHIKKVLEEELNLYYILKESYELS